jgi:mycothiol synthase
LYNIPQADTIKVANASNAMSNSICTIRTYQPADFHKYVQLQAEAEKLEPTGRCVSRQFIAEQLRRPNYHPEQDLFIVGIGEDIVGYMDVKPELTIGRVVLDCWVLPEHRKPVLTAELFSSSMKRAKKLGAKVAHVNANEDNVAVRKILLELGFSPVRQFLELRLDIGHVDGLDVHPTMPCRYLRPGEEDKLTRLQNCAFAGTWGYNPNTVEEITFRISTSTCSPEDIVLTYEGDKAIGCCWTGISCEEGIPSVRKGRIHMLGVAPDHRGKGIGGELAMAGLTRLRNRGLQVAELTVDSENRTARALYQSLGFEVQAYTLWYERVIG